MKYKVTVWKSCSHYQKEAPEVAVLLHFYSGDIQSKEKSQLSCRRIQNAYLCVLTPSHPHNTYKTPPNLYCTETATGKVTPFVATVLRRPSGSSISLCADGFFINQRQASSLLSFIVGKLWHLLFPAWKKTQILELSCHCLVVAPLVAGMLLLDLCSPEGKEMQYYLQLPFGSCGALLGAASDSTLHRGAAFD